MRTSTRRSAKEAVPWKLNASKPEELLRLVVDCLANSNGYPRHDHEGGITEQVVLDLDVNGARYLLVRLRKSSKVGVQLSPREHEIVRMVAIGHPNKIIANVLGISSWTVSTHLRRIFAKLGVGSRAAMVARLHERHDVGSASAQTGLAQTNTVFEPSMSIRQADQTAVAHDGVKTRPTAKRR
jgi:DNA-binding CsgD family transcriptional regulator